MSEIAIRTDRLGKRYRIAQREPYKVLREALTVAVSRPFRRRSFLNRPNSLPVGAGHEEGERYLWALKDVSFDIRHGEVVGIIGLNGAGKSTLLKVLSRITEPTEGEAEIRGRVGSLLEVGTGFHPELTGIENIYLNGAILGMRRAEIRRKVDEIMAFAETQKFADTPIKHYSSGMYMRLAFAVAAHLDFEILLVDEVLAVGDMLFQRKCLNKMRDVSQAGRTVLFVSHNMAAIGMLTTLCLWLDGGRLVDCGRTDVVIRRYADNPFKYRGDEREGAHGYADLTHPECRHGVKKVTERDVTFQSVRLLSSDGGTTDTFYEGEPIRVEFTMDVRTPIKIIEIICRVRRSDGYLVFTSSTGKRWTELSPGTYTTASVFEPNYLRPAWYYLELSIVTGSSVAQDAIPEAIVFNIIGKVAEDGDSRYVREAMGVIRVDYLWDDFRRS